MNYIKEYIDKIRSGEIITSKKVKQFYFKFIEPIILDQHPVYRFNEELSEVFINFAEEFCKQSKAPWAGKPLRLELFQKAKYQTLFGVVYREGGKRRFCEIFDTRGRKNGKSTENAALGLYLALIDQPGAEVYAAATTMAQARHLWEEAKAMIGQSALLRKYLKAKSNPAPIIETKVGNGKFVVLSSNVSTHDGLNVSGAAIDEVHELSRLIYDVLKQATSTRDEWIISMITTSGFVREGLYDDMYKFSEDILNGVIEADYFMPLIYELDDPEEIYDEEMWPKANPGLGTIKKIEALRNNVLQMASDTSFAPTVRTKDFNLRGVQNKSWLPYEVIRNDEIYPEEKLLQLKNAIVIGAYDLSRTTDMTAANTLLFDKEANKRIAITMYWITQNFFEAQTKQRGGYSVPWVKWIDQGLVRISGTNAIDYHDIANYFAANVKKYGWIYQFIHYDPWSATYLVDEMDAIGFSREYCQIPTIQGFKTLSVPIQTLMSDLRDSNLIYQNNSVTKWCFSNVELITDRNGNLMPKKANDQQFRKIDGMAVILNSYVGYCNNREVLTSK